MEINFKARVKTAQVLTPKALLKTVKNKGFFPKYSHDIASDKILRELSLLADKYRQSLSIEDKAELIQQERKMLYEELEHPELTLARNYTQIREMKLSRKELKNILPILNLFNANALRRIELLKKPFKTEANINKIEIIAEVYKNLKPTNKINKSTRGALEEVSDWLKKTLINDKKCEYKKELKKADFNSRTREPNILQKLFVEEKLDVTEQKKVKALISSILSDKDATPEVYHLAVWAGGKYRDNEIFEQLKEIALNKTETDTRKRELAIHSISLYAKEKSNEIKSLISSIEEEDSVFAPLGKIIQNKLNGTYYAKKDRELKEMDYNEKRRFKNWRNRFIISDEELSPRQINAIDRGLYPFRNLLKFFVKKAKRKVTLMGVDSYTKYAPERAGVRGFNNGINNSGDFYDSIMGVSTANGVFLGDKVERRIQDNMLSHECAHLLHNFLVDDICIDIKKLYKQALSQNKALDYYAECNAYEYFAQGLEAYVSIYKPHKDLIDNDAFSNTLYKLIYKDPELYKFIDDLVKNISAN